MGMKAKWLLARSQGEAMRRKREISLDYPLGGEWIRVCIHWQTSLCFATLLPIIFTSTLPPPSPNVQRYTSHYEYSYDSGYDSCKREDLKAQNSTTYIIRWDDRNKSHDDYASLSVYAVNCSYTSVNLFISESNNLFTSLTTQKYTIISATSTGVYHYSPENIGKSRRPWVCLCLGPIVFFQKVWKEKSWIFYMK